MGQQDVWDSFYRSNGRAWRGNCRMPDPLEGGGDALDLGCGSGKSVSTLIDMGYAVTGVDFSREAVDLCRGRFGDTAVFKVCDVSELPFGDGSFDYVTAVHVLEHIGDPDMGQGGVRHQVHSPHPRGAGLSVRGRGGRVGWRRGGEDAVRGGPPPFRGPPETQAMPSRSSKPICCRAQSAVYEVSPLWSRESG